MTRKVLDQSAAVQDSQYTTTIYLEGYQYTRAGTSARKTSYRCSYYRSAGCRGKTDLITRTRKFTNFVDHTCERGDEVGVPAVSDLNNTSGQINTNRSQTTVAAPAGSVTAVFQPPPVTPVFRLGPNQIDPILLGRIESPPLSLVRNTTLNFLQFNSLSGYGPNNTPNRVLGWAHPDLIELLKHAGSTIYVDTSFRFLPPGFEQCVALVVHDKPSGFFVPVFYVLCSTRTQATYRNALYLIVEATRRKLQPDEVVCGFDNELLNVLQAQFPNAVVKGSVHLFKQACRVRMEQLKILEEAVNVAMEKGVLDMLVSIPSDRVATAGIAWVKQQIKTKCVGAGVSYAQDQWRSFWVYFRRTWVTQFPPAVWNLHGLRTSVIARTSNPLEQFYRELDAAFASPEPGLQFFVATIDKMARRHVADLAAETTTLPIEVEVYSEVEASSEADNPGTESDGDADDDSNSTRIELSRGHERSEDDNYEAENGELD